MTGGTDPKPRPDPPTPLPYEATEGPPIFVVGNGRSGTTLMELMLSAHPRIYVCHESSFYSWFAKAMKNGRVEEYLEPYFTTLNFRWFRLRPEDVLERLSSPVPRAEAWRILEVIMRLKAAGAGRVRYGDKSPPHIWYLRSIFRDFPDARVIAMVRDPRGEVASVARMPWGCERDLPNCLINELARKAIDRQPQEILTVRLEDLQSDPRAQMQRVLEFVGEPWDEAVLDHPHHDPDPGRLPAVPWFSSSGAPVRVQGESWRRMSPRRLALIEAVCRKSMRRYGYEPADIPGKPGWFTIAWDLVASIPETVRYALAYMRMAAYYSKPEHWDWYDERGRELTKRLNPRFWEEHPDFVLPQAPGVPARNDKTPGPETP